METQASIQPGAGQDIVTVVSDLRSALGKKFYVHEDGFVDKRSSVQLSIGAAIQYHIPDAAAMADLLMQLSEDSSAAIINSAFTQIPVDEFFLIMSDSELLKYGIDRYDTTLTWPVTLEFDGNPYKVMGRFKELMVPSNWQLLDRDVDEHTPAHFAAMTYEEWLRQVDKLIPGVLSCTRVRAHSSSARVSINGHPSGGGNGHTWVQITNAADAYKLRGLVDARALALDMTWSKPRKCRKTGEVIGQGVATILDSSVFSVGRLTFVGKPEIYRV